MTRDKLAAALNLTARQIANLAAEGMPRRRRGRAFDYDVDAVVWYYQRKLERMEQLRPPGVEEAKARRELAQAELAEYELAEKRAQMISIDDHDRILGGMQDRLRAKHLNAPGKWAPQAVGLRTIAEGQLLLEQIMQECLLEITRVGDEIEDDNDDYAPQDTPERISPSPPTRRRRRAKAARPAA